MLTKDADEASDKRRAGGDQPPYIDVREEAGRSVWALSGVWNTRSVHLVDAQMRELEEGPAREGVVLDISAVSRMDTAGAWLIERLAEARREAGAEVEIVGASAAAQILLPAVREALEPIGAAKPAKRPFFVIRWLEALGRATEAAWLDFMAGMYILGSTIRGAQMKLGRGHAVNPAAIFNQIDRMGVGAIPVVVLISSIVGAIVAQQGAYQLRWFGAEIFIVDLVGILALRELGVLLTAIMVAGRSGSAITAEIGSMKMREEVDALKVIGLNPIGVLVFPRLVALVIAVPCLTIIANAASLGGGMIVAWIYSEIPPQAFIDRLRAGIDLSTIFAGLIKAPFMALIIGIVASIEGMKVGGSAESLGRHVTSAVVKSIFVVIVLDGLFAMFYVAIDF
ncbi:MlaE family lipid ABC transporter permease subunit [Neoaquamicrobium sediminum]|uniref:MlaE family lipid ABC transporter permease subunit n=1 Tax=Neoaquamicrobium sediminum TaxID=1849104 RepID=UPI003BA89627